MPTKAAVLAAASLVGLLAQAPPCWSQPWSNADRSLDVGGILESARAAASTQRNDSAEGIFKDPSRYLPDASAVFSARGYDPGSLREIPRSPKVYILGQDAYSRAVFEEIKATITDPSLKALSLDDPDHSFAFPFRGACFVKLTQRPSDPIEYIATWTGIPAEFVEHADVSLAGEELGMALHELRHCSQPKGMPVAVGEDEADLAFIRAQPLSGDPDLVRRTMYIRALFVLNSGIQEGGTMFAPLQTYYPSALSFDAILRGAAPSDAELAAQSYTLLKNTLAMILAYQAQRAGGFKQDTPHFAKIAMSVKSFIEFERGRKPESDQEKLALRAAQLYMDGLNYFLPAFASSFDGKYGRIDFPQ
jgi:hypothetical protein